MTQPESLQWGTKQARLALTATILGSGLAFLDGSVVSVALPHIQADLGGGLATTQWAMDGYLLTLGSLVLIGGSLGDLLGKRRIFLTGVVLFGVTSVLCGLAPTAQLLIVARMLQGVAAALLVPTSLALLNAVFSGSDRGKAIGAWSGLSGIFTAVGPPVGGLLVDSVPHGWRWVFLINLPLVVAAYVLGRSAIPPIPGTRQPGPLRSQIDIAGGLLVAIGLGLIVGPLIEVQRLPRAVTVGAVIVGLGLLAGFVALERKRERTGNPDPMVRMSLFGIRSFTVANAVTFVVYGGLQGMFFLVTIGLQQGLGYSALAAGLAGLPVTIVLALFSSRVGGTVGRWGARPLLTLGPLIMAVGILILATMAIGQPYWASVFTGFVVFSIGLVLVVAPVTTTALAELPAEYSGVGSGINNAIARIAGLIAIILLPLIAGMSASQDHALTTGEAFLSDYRPAMLAAASICALGGLLAWFGFHPNDGKLSLAEPSTD